MVGVRQPVIAAIDVTPWKFYPSPYKDDEDIDRDNEPIIVNGEEKVPIPCCTFKIKSPDGRPGLNPDPHR